MDEADKKLLATIEQHDCAVLCIEADDDGPSVAFSVGLFQRFQQPEILISGLPTPSGQKIINACRDRLREGHTFRPGFSYGPFVEGRRIAMRVLHADHYEGYLGTARWLYDGDEFPCLQAFWPDAQGRFPWDDGCDASVSESQPRLDHPWAFRGEPVGKRIWLDQRVADPGDPILRIDRLEPSEWRFSCDLGATAAYIRPPLWQALQRDPTLTAAAKMPIGGTLIRQDAGQPWKNG
jgi:hypothetical protein